MRDGSGVEWRRVGRPSDVSNAVMGRLDNEAFSSWLTNLKTGDFSPAAGHGAHASSAHPARHLRLHAAELSLVDIMLVVLTNAHLADLDQHLCVKVERRHALDWEALDRSALFFQEWWLCCWMVSDELFWIFKKRVDKFMDEGDWLK